MGASAVSRLVTAAASTNGTLAATGPVKLHFVTAYNAAASVRYLKLYNKATAPTVGTDVPTMTIAIPATSQLNLNIADGMLFVLGLGFGLTTGSADNDTAALTANDVVGLNLGYA